MNGLMFSMHLFFIETRHYDLHFENNTRKRIKCIFFVEIKKNVHFFVVILPGTITKINKQTEIKYS